MNQQLIETLSSARLIKKSEQSVPNKNIDDVDSPWYIKIILAFSGWLAALFIIGVFASLFPFLIRNYPLLLTIGSILIVSSFLLLKMKKSEFLEHLALATSLAGQGLVIFGLDRAFNFDHEGLVWFCIGLLQLVLLLMPNYVHRVFSSFLAAISFGIALYYFKGNALAPYLYGAFLMMITAIVWLNEFNFPKHIEKLQAVGYGLVFSLIALSGTKLFISHAAPFRFGRTFHKENTWFEPWMGELLLSAVLIFVVWKILRRIKPILDNKTTMLALFATLLISLISTQAYGLVIGIMILLLGFSASNRILLGLGILLLLAFISRYYYFLENTLLQKSITLLIIGLVMIGIRFTLLKIYPDDHKATERHD